MYDFKKQQHVFNKYLPLFMNNIQNEIIPPSYIASYIIRL